MGALVPVNVGVGVLVDDARVTYVVVVRWRQSGESVHRAGAGTDVGRRELRRRRGVRSRMIRRPGRRRYRRRWCRGSFDTDDDGDAGHEHDGGHGRDEAPGQRVGGSRGHRASDLPRTTALHSRLKYKETPAGAVGRSRARGEVPPRRETPRTAIRPGRAPLHAAGGLRTRRSRRRSARRDSRGSRGTDSVLRCHHHRLV